MSKLIMEKSFIRELKKTLNKTQNIVVIPHKNPDGDALGSCLALFHFLIKSGHNCNIISPSNYPEFLNWLPGQKAIIKYSSNNSLCEKIIDQCDVIFTLDFNSLNRIDILGDVVKKSSSIKVMIDHHENPDNYANLIYSNPKLGSTCEMIFNVIEELDFSLLDKSIAICIYTGIMTDSGSFRYPSTSSKTHLIISKLLSTGISHSSIYQNIYDIYSFDRISLLAKALSNIRKIEALNAVYLTLTQYELNENNFNKGDSEGFVNYGLSIKGMIFSTILIEHAKEKIIKMSFRSKGSFDVNKFARKYFNGGGHVNAAGGISYENINQTILDLVNATKKYSDQLI